MGALLAGSAAGQERLERLEVVLWPEYDRPAVLVMLRAWLPADAALPAMVRLPLPPGVAQPHAVARRAADGSLLLAQYSIEPAADGSTVQLLTDVPEIRLEYYGPLESTALVRRYSFEWRAGLEIGNAAFEVMQPIGASAMTVTPETGPATAGPDGLSYFRGELGGIATDEGFSIGISYVKPSPELTASALQPAAPPPGPAAAPVAAPGAEPTAGGGGPGTWGWLWPVALIVVSLSALAIVWLLARRPGSGSRS